MKARKEVHGPGGKRSGKVKAKRLLPIHLRVSILVDPSTGAKVKAFLPAFKADRMMCKEREYKTGDVLRADITKPRNPKFNNLVHGLGDLIRKNVEGFEECEDAHAVIKRLQRESGVCCDEQAIEVPGVGKLICKVAQSIAFDSMEDAQFSLFWQGICQHIVRKYWPSIDADTLESMVDMMPEVAK